jgi:hypothetical protein
MRFCKAKAMAKVAAAVKEGKRDSRKRKVFPQHLLPGRAFLN